VVPRASGVTTETTLNPIEVRLNGGMYALNRFLITLQNKRMPVVSFAVGKDEHGMRATMLLDCPPETARRYTMLLSALEDVQQIGAASKLLEIALLKIRGNTWRESAACAGVEVHENGDTIVAVGQPETLGAWLAEIKDDLDDFVRFGPVARPGDGKG
jgi:hypothetical protein